MPGWLYAVIVVCFAAGGVVLVRRTQGGAFVERLPLEPSEDVLLEEEGLTIFHRSRKTAVRGGGTTTLRVRAVLTSRRILVATGGPEGRHRFVILMILDYTTPAERVTGSGLAAYREKFRLENGYPTYAISAKDVTVKDEALRIVVPFPEAGPGWGPPPEVAIHTKQAARYRDAIARA